MLPLRQRKKQNRTKLRQPRPNLVRPLLPLLVRMRPSQPIRRRLPKRCPQQAPKMAQLRKNRSPTRTSPRTKSSRTRRARIASWTTSSGTRSLRRSTTSCRGTRRTVPSASA
uniref:(northern house mosquito) hypothetical protein n=1 Tax=Culex pipiens TaxID=7175 RepID=A0A8D8IUI3_CULPI